MGDKVPRHQWVGCNAVTGCAVVVVMVHLLKLVLTSQEAMVAWEFPTVCCPAAMLAGPAFGVAGSNGGPLTNLSLA